MTSMALDNFLGTRGSGVEGNVVLFMMDVLATINRPPNNRSEFAVRMSKHEDERRFK